MRRSLCALLLLVGCASGPTAAPRSVSTDRLIAERAIAVLEHHHLSHRVLDRELGERALERLRRLLAPEGGCRARPRLLAAELQQALRVGDFSFAQALARACGRPEPSLELARNMMLRSLAQAFDEHSSYLSAAELNEPGDPTQPADRSGDARGRLVQRSGMSLAWLVLPSFYLHHTGQSATGDLRQILAQLSLGGVDAVVLDLRGNGGGAISEAVRALGAFGCRGGVARSRARGGELTVFEAPEREDAYHGPLVVLIDGGSASAAELFAAAVQDQRRGVIAGARSYGKATQQTLIHLSSPLGSTLGALQVTTHELLRAGGESWQAGVLPEVTLSRDEVDGEGLDAALRSAIALTEP